MDASAKGSANTVWLNFTKEAHLESREIIGIRGGAGRCLGGPYGAMGGDGLGGAIASASSGSVYSGSSCHRTVSRWGTPRWSSTRATTVSATASTVVGRL